MPVLLSWNVAGRVRESQERQIAAIATFPFDLVCLQEVTPTTLPRWKAALAEQGLHVCVAAWPDPPRGSRRFAVLVAGPEPLQALPPLDIPWPERHLAVRTRLDQAELEIHTLHAPLSQKPEQVKVRTLEMAFAAVTGRDDADPLRIIAGDFNTPQYESREGVIQTFARTRSGALRRQRGERHDRAELALIGELPRRGWKDAFRALHGYQRRDRSWMAPSGYGWRLDHIIVSPGLVPLRCDYVHDWREQRLSDHSAIWAEIALQPDPAG